MRQIVQAIGLEEFSEFDAGGRPRVQVVTMTQYKETFPFPNAFPPTTLARFVGQMVSESGKTQLRTAETEKYAHVTYFFNCGLETPFPGEDRELVPSPRVATYDLKPEMSADGITDVLCRSIKRGEIDFTLCNYANGDMVGHTGILPAAISAVETVDECLTRVLVEAEKAGTTILITADHGNCELMIDPETGGPHTAHTTNPVPFLVVTPNGGCTLRSGGRLSDVGPTILNMLSVEVPLEMTGTDLREGA
jgi:2,3-bisphosphoglycerate-independent phosphoglycerate mutase